MKDSGYSVKTALISVSDKSGVIELARALAAREVLILSTGGTASLLSEAGIPVRDVSEHTGFQEIMDGRVKTLHPTIHGGILGRRGMDDEVMATNGITPIDMVVVNLYPFEKTVADPDCALDSAIENIDIGGPTMLRAAAKNHAYVTVVVDQQDYSRVLQSMAENQGAVDSALRFDLAVKTFEHTARYDGAIASYLGAVVDGSQGGVLSDAESADRSASQPRWPRTLNIQMQRKQALRYGENPHQNAAFYLETDPDPASISAATQIKGKALSYNNIADTDAALECVKQFPELPTCVIVKHANPCGVATAESISEAYLKAFSTDPESAFGGIIALNTELDAATARLIIDKQFVEVIIAPVVSTAAEQIVAEKENVRLLVCGALQSSPTSLDYKRVSGGMLVQDRDLLSFKELKVVTTRSPDEPEMRDLRFAWKVASFVKSNAIVYARNSMTIGVGAGQMSRVNSARIAAIKAEHAGLEVAGSVMASDAFFPFRDGIENAAAAGITAVIQPGGSMRDEEVIDTANKHNIAMLFTATRHFRH